ncbi:response regulator transcription factor [Blautia liquoris]|uniref:Stage 0 sporulation protein A homolog n=1 Tax=Blautia liquoris TaxID=2779518 RepID=A0A7M2RK74_9FIRM|nr:response regulator transcription factor [Blautia liquoris]QOV20669.1 response regulator transcription factor [Blautia liquoris]
MHILIVEDEPIIRKELRILLENALYQVTVLEEFDSVAEQVMLQMPDLVLLDLNLPDAAGFDICTEIRKQSEVPVIFLTGRTDSMDELTGMLKGGDDYITKPYQASILLARIAAVLKRTRTSDTKESTVLTCHGVQLDLARTCLKFGEKCVDLSKNELKILHYLFRHEGEVISRLDLIEYLWDNQVFIDDNTLSVNVTRIREKLKSIGVTGLIETKRGMGYRV